ncbi:signal peptidase II [Aureisphaera galaxeae]|uniref:signal peptidase II n=1 Tax=Aureisphaera galaxeae TaxID=1538023 RepID=UPI00234FD07B|nr:signal peptidase II [Aureisphaera galaxeae]MDC8004956.1 signal peptidase II [Aureisphaera galaxeae]
MKRVCKIIALVFLIGCNISCDQISKEKARTEISENEIIEVVDDHFVLKRVENTGAAMSLGANLPSGLKVIFLKVLPLTILFLMFFYAARKREISNWNIVAFSFIIGGGIGNIYDRVLYNSVTDFMYLEFASLHTGIFNMADVSVVMGTLMLVSSSLFSKWEIRKLKTNDV